MKAKTLLKSIMPKFIWNILSGMKRHINRGINKMITPIVAVLGKRLAQVELGWQGAFQRFEKSGFHIYPAHYYSPIPEVRELLNNKQRWFRESDLSDIRFNKQEQLRLCGAFSKFQKECKLLSVSTDLDSNEYGAGYGAIEALILHCFLRHFRPDTVIEVGSGTSSFFSSNALSMNRKEGKNSSLICIEPYPYQKLKSIPSIHKIIERKVQDIDIEFFQQLNEGDILFIDSSHTVKIGSDVNYLILEVLPSLKKGVMIHFHDIFFPYLFPYPLFWIFENFAFWQEAVLLKAFLTNNNDFEIIYCSSYLNFKNPELLKSTFPLYDNGRHFPSSIWLRKVSGSKQPNRDEP
jgi:hypothetical protein